MKRARLYVVLGFVLVLANLRPLTAQDASAVMGLPMQFSANLQTTDSKGKVGAERMYRDHDKVRVDVDSERFQITEIIRGDEKKYYLRGIVPIVVSVSDYGPK